MSLAPSDEKLQKAIARFEEAKALEPAFVPAWLAYAYGASGDRAARWLSSRT